MKTDDPIIFSFEQTMKLSVPQPIKDRLMKLINLSWLGTENCNKVVNGQYVSVIEDADVEKQLTEAHFNLHRSEVVKITVHVHKSGRKSYTQD